MREPGELWGINNCACASKLPFSNLCRVAWRRGEKALLLLVNSCFQWQRGVSCDNQFNKSDIWRRFLNLFSIKMKLKKNGKKVRLMPHESVDSQESLEMEELFSDEDDEVFTRHIRHESDNSEAGRPLIKKRRKVGRVFRICQAVILIMGIIIRSFIHRKSKMANHIQSFVKDIPKNTKSAVGPSVGHFLCSKF